MAFNTVAAVQNSATAAVNAATDNWKAQGFINLYLPSKDGKRRKLGAIPLKVAKAAEKELIAYLEADEANIENLASKLIVEYQSASGNDSHGFDL
jgi:hypothetical protein